MREPEQGPGRRILMHLYTQALIETQHCSAALCVSQMNLFCHNYFVFSMFKSLAHVPLIGSEVISSPAVVRNWEHPVFSQLRKLLSSRQRPLLSGTSESHPVTFSQVFRPSAPAQPIHYTFVISLLPLLFEKLRLFKNKLPGAGDLAQ